ncbi:MAG: hypothetical protein PHU95_02730 [Candidatus Thermoplasmatota archaeon]|nr:hypothetical protein [Candidatus Thermoplasmatota archaeon]MDD5778347.1 hypothetical protein [Candidatus Thermoplasmatota archaeon]
MSGPQQWWRDRQGISAMQDALLFCVMVSISGALLIPAFTSTIHQDVLWERQQEEKANALLHQVMTCTVNEAGYLTAESLLDQLNVERQGLAKQVAEGMLGREQLHRTYADLCTECVACQFRWSGRQINMLTRNFTESLQTLLDEFFEEQLDPGYGYNFTVVWRPIEGFDFGGVVCSGATVPSTVDVFTAGARVALPPSPVASEAYTLTEAARHYIQNISGIHDAFSEYTQGEISEERYRQALASSLSAIVNKTVWEGFDLNHDGDCRDKGEMKSLLDIALDFLWRSRYLSFRDVFGEALSLLTDVVSEGLNKQFDVMVNKIIEEYLSELAEGISVNATMSEPTREVTNEVKKKAREFVNTSIHTKIPYAVEKMMSNINGAQDIQPEMLRWLFLHINPWRAQLSLAIWEAPT